MSNLKYFQSVEIRPNIRETFEQLETVLQTEHKSDGSHPIASSGQSGFMTPEHAQKIDQMWDWFQKIK